MQTSPIQGSDRIVALDVLRGFALFGILVVNTLTFAEPTQTLSHFGYMARPDAWLYFAVNWIAIGKFYGLFSFLFGVGFAVQMARWGSHGPSRFRRRLAVLLGLGLLHGLLLWEGDILLTYAMAGLILSWFRQAEPRSLLKWALIFLGLGVLSYACLGGMFWLILKIDPARSGEIMKELQSDALKDAAQALQVLGSGSYREVLAFRAEEFLMRLSSSVFMLPHVLCMFLLGLWAGKRQLVDNWAASTALRQRMLWSGLLIGLPVSALAAWMGRGGFAASFHGVILSIAINLVGASFLTFGYVAVLLRLLASPRWGRWVLALRWSGRMALTNYLTQSLVMTSVFYGYGLGLYGQLPFYASLSIALSLACAQVPLSRWWLSRHAMGPMEWVWRRHTYGRWDRAA